MLRRTKELRHYAKKKKHKPQEKSPPACGENFKPRRKSWGRFRCKGNPEGLRGGQHIKKRSIQNHRQIREKSQQL